MIGFLQRSSRLFCLKLRVPGGKMALISAYAPHSGWPFDSRQDFFHQLADMYQRTSINVPKLILGDLNARILRRLPGEGTIIGGPMFGTPTAALRLASNRELLLETCAALDVVVANTFFVKPPEEQVS